MPDSKSPVLARRHLRVELTRLREERELSQSQVAEKLDWSTSKVIRIENGSVGISVTDVRALLGLYKVDEDLVEALAAHARVARERRWWNTYGDTISHSYQEFIGYEDAACRLRQFHPTLIPGLLQTTPYITAINEALAIERQSPDRYDQYLKVRLQRQQEVLDKNRPDFTVIVYEAALMCPVGGVDAMRAQLQHLAELTEEGKVSVAVLPFAAGPHIGLHGAFVLMDFPSPDDDSVLYLEDAQGDVARYASKDVALYGDHFDRLLARSVQDSAAVSFIERAADRLGD